MRLKAYMFLWVVLQGFSGSLCAKVQTACSYERFNRLINAKHLCVAYLYRYVRSCKNKCAKEAYQEQFDIFKAASCVPRFKDADVSFITVNLEQSKLACLAGEYDLTTTPSFLLFKDGSVYDDGCAPARIDGCASKADLIALLEDNVGDDIDRILDYKQEQRKQELEENLMWYNYYGYPWYGYCSPWYGCGYYGPACYPGYGGGCGRGGACFSFGLNVCN